MNGRKGSLTYSNNCCIEVSLPTTDQAGSGSIWQGLAPPIEEEEEEPQDGNSGPLQDVCRCRVKG